MVLEVGKSRIKVLSDLVSGEGPLPGLQMAIFSWSPHMADSKEREKQGLLCLFSEGTNLIHEGSTLMACSPLKGPMS